MKTWKGKKLQKDQLVLMILAGILLCVIALPVKEKDTVSFSKKYDLSDSNNAILKKTNQTVSQGDGIDDFVSEKEDTYTIYWENKLEEALSKIEGVGEAEVLITLKESETRILEKDIPEQISETIETDAAGGSRTITQKQQEEATIYTVNEAGQNVPYISKIIEPSIEGVVVIAQGGDSAIVRQNIIDAIQVLFDIDSNKIRVVKMKTKKK